MGAVSAALESLDEPAVGRVLRWAQERFGVAAASSALDPQPAAPDEAREFSDVGELVHAAGAASGPARALCAAYWFQVVQGQPGWSGAEVNNALKNLGHGLANVTKTLNSLKGRRPALVMQVQKSGRSRQARKVYRLTVEGTRAVEEMVGHRALGEG